MTIRTFWLQERTGKGEDKVEGKEGRGRDEWKEEEERERKG